MTLGQQEPVVPRMLYQPPAGLDQALLQTGCLTSIILADRIDSRLLLLGRGRLPYIDC
jgi:hypothetical protein